MQKTPTTNEAITITELQKKWPGLTDWMLAKGINDRLGEVDDEDAWPDFPRPFAYKQHKGSGKIGKGSLRQRKPQLGFPFPRDSETPERVRPYNEIIKMGIAQYKFTDTLFLLSEVEEFEKNNPFVFDKRNNIRIVINNNITDENDLEKEFSLLKQELDEKQLIIKNLEEKLIAKEDRILRSRSDPATIKHLSKRIDRWKEITRTFVILAMECQKREPKKRSKAEFNKMITALNLEALSPTELDVFREALPETYVDREKREKKAY